MRQVIRTNSISEQQQQQDGNVIVKEQRREKILNFNPPAQED